MEAANDNNISCAYQENQSTAVCYSMFVSGVWLLLQLKNWQDALRSQNWAWQAALFGWKAQHRAEKRFKNKEHAMHA